MTASEYWDSDIFLLMSYEEAYKKRTERELRENEYQAWLNGVYIQQAVGSVLSKDHKYPTKLLIIDTIQEQEKLAEMSWYDRMMHEADQMKAYVASKPIRSKNA